VKESTLSATEIADAAPPENNQTNTFSHVRSLQHVNAALVSPGTVWIFGIDAKNPNCTR